MSGATYHRGNRSHRGLSLNAIWALPEMMAANYSRQSRSDSTSACHTRKVAFEKRSILVRMNSFFIQKALNYFHSNSSQSLDEVQRRRYAHSLWVNFTTPFNKQWKESIEIQPSYRVPINILTFIQIQEWKTTNLDRFVFMNKCRGISGYLNSRSPPQNRLPSSLQCTGGTRTPVRDSHRPVCS